MSAPSVFLPPRRRGLLIQLGAALILSAGAAACLGRALSRAEQSITTLLALLAILLCVPIGLLLLRSYALLNASYTIERDGLRLRWGLRAEDIPIPQIEWVRPAADLVLPLPLPPLAWPGALLGTIEVTDLGPVEFLASERGKLLLVATASKIYAISPANPGAFNKSFHRATELGSLEPLPSFSARPAAYITHIWDDLAARIFLATGLGLTLLLFISASLGAGSLLKAALGIAPAAPPSGLALLLPLMGAAAFLVNMGLGLVFYRRPSGRALAYLLWGGGCAAPFIFLIGSLFNL